MLQRLFTAETAESAEKDLSFLILGRPGVLGGWIFWLFGDVLKVGYKTKRPKLWLESWDAR
jgi:hypothetical protein